MALNTPNKVFSEGVAVKVSVYRYVNVTAGDTFQVSGDFTACYAAWMVNTGGTPQNPVISANTLLTVQAGPNKDDGYLVVWGSTS